MTKWAVTITLETSLISELVKVLNFMNKLKFRYTIYGEEIAGVVPANGREGGLVK